MIFSLQDNVLKVCASTIYSVKMAEDFITITP